MVIFGLKGIINGTEEQGVMYGCEPITLSKNVGKCGLVVIGGVFMVVGPTSLQGGTVFQDFRHGICLVRYILIG